MESSDATANTIRYGKWKALARGSTEPSVEAETEEKQRLHTVQVKQRACEHVNSSRAVLLPQ